LVAINLSKKGYTFFLITVKIHDICASKKRIQIQMGMNKNTILAWATFIMIVMGLVLIGMGAFKYDDVAGWGFAATGIGFLAIAWVFNALKGRV